MVGTGELVWSVPLSRSEFRVVVPAEDDELLSLSSGGGGCC